jgi:CHASE2 domain-containing sensor protein
MGLAGLAAGFGVIGMAIGFATLLGLTASAASAFVLGLVLVVGAVLLWRAHRAARIVIGAAVALLALSSLARMVVDSVTFISVVGTVLSLLALTAMGYLLVSPGVREHVRDGVPLRLR